MVSQNNIIKRKVNTDLNLRILSWNAQSITAHAAELKLYIENNAESPMSSASKSHGSEMTQNSI